MTHYWVPRGFLCTESPGLGSEADEVVLVSRWTTDKPVIPGWYWWRSSPTGKGEIHFVNIDMIADMLHGVYVDFPTVGQWSGPLMPPAD